MENMENKGQVIITCGKCNEYQGTAAQVRGHKMKCQGPTVIDNASPPPAAQASEPRQRETPNRKERVPFGVPQKRLPDVPDDDGFQYRIVNDGWAKDPDRVQRALRGGYEKAEGYEPRPVGTNDNGSPITGIVMRIPENLYEQDQKEKQKVVDKVDQAIMKGTFEQQAGDRRYIPQGIKIHSSFNENG